MKCSHKVDWKNLNKPFYYFKDINIGIILIGFFFVLEFGSFQGLYPIIGSLKIPFIISSLSVIYSTYLIISQKVDFESVATKRFVFLCLFIIVYSGLCTKYAAVRSEVIKGFIVYLANYLIIVTCVKKPSQLLLLVDIWLASILFSCYHGFMQGGIIWGSRWMNDENQLSTVASMVIPFSFLLYRVFQSKIKKVFYLVCLVFAVSVNVLSLSRGGVLAMVVVVILCWFLTAKKMANLIIISIAVALIINFASETYFKEIKTIGQGFEETTAKSRVYFWGLAYQMFREHPVFGVGPLNYPYYFSGYDKEFRYRSGKHKVAHSTPVEWLAETGVVGCAILIFLLLSVYNNWRLVTTYKKEYGDNEGKYFSICIYSYNNAIAISQVGYWVSAMFISLTVFPFYWHLPAFSESLKNIFLQHEKRSEV